MKLKIILEYKGTRYQGWQVQKDTKTVQGTLFEAFRKLYPKSKIDLQGSGRTDAGVHALAQCAHAEISGVTDARNLVYKLNDNLPADIVVRSAEPVSAQFHSRYSAVARSYIYQISTRPSGFYKDYVWWVKDPLNVPAMADALSLLKGFHQFSGFAQVDQHGEDTRVEMLSADCKQFENIILIRLKADRFLWKMVRRIVGSVVEVGRGKVDADYIKKLLNAKDSAASAPLTSPPSGLFLEKVYYPGDMEEPEFKPLFTIL